MCNSQFQSNVTSKQLKHVKCVVCQKKLFPMFLDDCNVSLEKQPITDGTATLIDCNYGSKYDGRVFILGMCDDCLAIAIKNKSAYEVKL